jgi:hypothetical protein
MLKLSGVRWLGDTPLFVSHRHIEHMALELGLKRVVLTEQGDSGLVRGISMWFRAGGGSNGCAGSDGGAVYRPPVTD